MRIKGCAKDDGGICPVIKDRCLACDDSNGVAYCSISSEYVQKGDECPDEEPEEDALLS